MKIYKQNLLFLFSVIVFFFNCFSSSKNNKSINYNNTFHVDTIQGYFLYEVNVPSKCFTRFDQIEQGNNLILFDSIINGNRIESLYKKGVFFYEYQPIVDQYINDHKTGIAQNKDAISRFNNSVNYFIHRDDTLYSKTFYYDEKKILAYKKVYAKFSFVSLGNLKQLIPDMANYKCCYSNMKATINSFFIVDIFDFKVF